MAFLLFLLPLVLLWVLFVRPQQRRMRQAQAMVSSLEIDDEIITSGGIYGTITDADDTSLWLEIAPDVIVRVLRGAVAQRVPTDLDELVEHEHDDDLDEDHDHHDDDDPDTETHESNGSGSNGSSAGVPNATTPGPSVPESKSGDDEA